MKKICEYCGEEFEAKSKIARYCSKACCNKVYCQSDKYKQTKKNRNKSEDYRLKEKFRHLLRSVVSSDLSKLRSEYWKLLPYTPHQLKEHIESMFTDGMTWDNHGKVWHLDHIKPLASYVYVDKNGVTHYDEIMRSNCLTNIRPILKQDNLHKSSAYNGKHYKANYKDL